MEINKKKLERYIAKKCPNAEFSPYNDEIRCFKQQVKYCQEWGLSIECPSDCPHLNAKVLLCKEGKCKYVKKEIEKLL